VKPWFVVRPGAARKGKLIRIPFRYTGSEILTSAKVSVFGERIFGVSSVAGGYFGSSAELGNLVSGDGLLLIIRTDDAPGRLKFTLDASRSRPTKRGQPGVERLDRPVAPTRR
jgi:hypothetical protein